MKKLILFFITVLIVSANMLKPTITLKASGGVTDIVKQNNLIYVATAASSVDIFDLKTNKKLKTIKVPKIKDFMGDLIDAKIYSVDVVGDEVLILSQGEHGFRNVDIYKDNKLQSIISIKKKLYIAKAKFISKNQILLGLLSNEILLYDINKKAVIWQEQVSLSKFSDFDLDDSKTKVVIADESGDLHILNIKDGKVLKIYGGQNVDNIFQVRWHKNIIATAGQDRRCVVYDTNYDTSYYKIVDFLIYSVGVSLSGNLVGFASDEQNNVTIFKAKSKQEVVKLTGNKINISNILFISDHQIIVTNDSQLINFYKIKKDI